MNALPVVKVAPHDAGWTAACSHCPDFRPSSAMRPPVDVLAKQHRAKCATKAARRAHYEPKES